MRNLRLRQFCCIAMLIIMLTACTPADKTSQIRIVTPQPYSSAPIVTSEPTQQPRCYRQAQAVTTLGKLPAQSVRSYLSLGDGRVLAAWDEFLEDGVIIHADIIDIVEQKIEHSISIEGASALYLQKFADGQFVFGGNEDVDLYVCDSQLNIVKRIDLPDAGGVISYDLQHFYFVQDRILYDYDIATGTTQRLNTTVDLRIASTTVDGTDGTTMGVYAYKSEYAYDTFLCLIDLTCGAPIVMRDDVESCQRTDSGTINALSYSDEDFSLDIIIEALGDTRHTNTHDLGIMDIDCMLLPNSPYLMHFFECDIDIPENWENGTVLYSLGEQVTQCDLTDYGINESLWNAAYLPEERLIVADEYENGASNMIVIDVEQLEFTNVCSTERYDFEPVEMSLATARIDEQAQITDGDLTKTRQYADEIEQRYGVTVLLSEQCTAPCSQSGYKVTTTNNADFSNESAQVMQSLKCLDAALAIYPEGFCKQFRNNADECGLRFMLVGPIESQNGVVGFHYDNTQWYNIAIDIDLWDITSTLHHELWHATESKLCSVDSYGFNDGTWETLNPDGFSYIGTYSYDAWEYSTLDDWIYLMEPNDADVYFIDYYSKTFPGEDRARIMEYIMTFDTDAVRLMQSPHIKAKLQVMADAVRRGFDDTGWDTAYWERYF